jgi:hypothetical protein
LEQSLRGEIEPKFSNSFKSFEYKSSIYTENMAVELVSS